MNRYILYPTLGFLGWIVGGIIYYFVHGMDFQTVIEHALSAWQLGFITLYMILIVFVLWIKDSIKHRYERRKNF